MGVTSPWNVVPTLGGHRVVLVPLEAAHGPALAELARSSGLHEAWYTNVPAPDAVDRYIDKALREQAMGRALPFAVLDPDGQVVGSTRFYDLDPAVPTLKIGYTWYAPRVQRTGLNTETKLLLLEHAFEALGCASVFFETSWFNHASRTAIARLGAKQDGVLRNHKRHADGSLRDTVVFSLIDGEWPAARRHLQFKLDSHP
ncbi:MAG: GNAT family N-acetyltransferase [Xanthomonadales bacterium]|nr:GNAT family N-acetyltransferase [Xanthomonadaceae bacterium]MBN8224206.1 GNAT family N-acetyltransferase [Xanthomonadales bacterium]MCA0198119.1 GNAT family N-acetyltransferase [Pseudomonadota bacterium]HRF84025.1 GNAT family N-acetyltransferase [Pseudoxanthomonas sp.]